MRCAGESDLPEIGCAETALPRGGEQRDRAGVEIHGAESHHVERNGFG